MKRKFYGVMIFSFLCIACSRPPEKTPPEGYRKCIFCLGTGKEKKELGFLDFYIDCTHCGSIGYVKSISLPTPSTIITSKDDDNDGYNKHSGGEYVNPEPIYDTRQVWVDCFDCHGTGRCSYCNGDGWDISTYSDGSYNTTYKCPVCHGGGTCQMCYGNRGHYEMQTFRVR